MKRMFLVLAIGSSLAIAQEKVSFEEKKVPSKCCPLGFPEIKNAIIFQREKDTGGISYHAMLRVYENTMAAAPFRMCDTETTQSCDDVVKTVLLDTLLFKALVVSALRHPDHAQQARELKNKIKKNHFQLTSDGVHITQRDLAHLLVPALAWTGSKINDRYKCLVNNKKISIALEFQPCIHQTKKVVLDEASRLNLKDAQRCIEAAYNTDYRDISPLRLPESATFALPEKL